MRARLLQTEHRTSLAVLLALVLLLAAGCGSVAASPAQPAITTPEESMSTDQSASPGPSVLECGAPFEHPARGPLTLTAHFPASVRASEQQVTGTVEVASRGDETRGVVTPRAEAFLVRDGLIVTLPLPQDAVGQRLDLVLGQPPRMPATASLVACAGGVLASGTYELYVRVLLNRDDGPAADSLGGPWPLEVR